MSQIKRGVSLYSYQEEYFLRKMNLEDCIKAVSDMGATGIEIIPEQMINEYPNLSDEFLEKWFGWMKKYNVEPTCADGFLEAEGPSDDVEKNLQLGLGEVGQEEIEDIVRDWCIVGTLKSLVIEILTPGHGIPAPFPETSPVLRF